MASIERYLGREREVLFFTWRLILCDDGVENERMEFLDLVINIMVVMGKLFVLVVLLFC